MKQSFINYKILVLVLLLPIAVMLLGGTVEVNATLSNFISYDGTAPQYTYENNSYRNLVDGDR